MSNRISIMLNQIGNANIKYTYFIAVSLNRPTSNNNTVVMNPLRTQMVVLKIKASWRNADS